MYQVIARNVKSLFKKILRLTFDNYLQHGPVLTWNAGWVKGYWGPRGSLIGEAPTEILSLHF